MKAMVINGYGLSEVLEAANIDQPVVSKSQVLVEVHGAGLKAGQRILINGASGGVGTFAVQIAKLMGAKVTGVCSGRNAALVSSLGADQVVDYTKDDFVDGDEKYDVIFDTVGNKTFSDCRRVLCRGGAYMTIVPNVTNIVLSFLTAFLPGRRCQFVSLKPSAEGLSWLKEKIEANKVKPVMDRVYPLEQAKAAHDYLETGHARGKVVLRVDRGGGGKE